MKPRRRKERKGTQRVFLLGLVLLIGVELQAGTYRLVWDPPGGYTPAGYHVCRSEVSGGPYTRLTTSPIPGTEYADNNVYPAYTYYYVVIAVHSSGQESGYSNEAAITLGQYDLTPEPGALIVNAGPDIQARMGEMLILSGSHRDPEGKPVTYLWTQASGPVVSISGSDRAEAAFITPTLQADAVLTFVLTVKDSLGGSSSDSLIVTVRKN